MRRRGRIAVLGSGWIRVGHRHRRRVLSLLLWLLLLYWLVGPLRWLNDVLVVRLRVYGAIGWPIVNGRTGGHEGR